MKVVYQKAPIAVIGTTNYAPYAQAIIASGANVAFETLDTGDSVGLAAALKAAGFKGPIFNGVTYLPGSLGQSKSQESALDGVYVVNEFPADENNTPAIKQAEKDLAATGQPPYLTSGVSIGYWSAIVLEQMLRATLKSVGGNPNKVTGATIAQDGQCRLHLHRPDRRRHRQRVLPGGGEHSHRLRHPVADRSAPGSSRSSPTSASAPSTS